ncbi:FAD-dependent oxidoreductase [Chryseobacterium kwangjuense]|uniref:Flavin-dependent monooxygenase n=1 Tax=Chryseobacterium kwangjuense TaxID=267125 RepID=A0ABW9K616_9FLAO
MCIRNLNNPKIMLLKNKKTAIIGAGPVGLTLAKLLQQSGADVTVYERDQDPQARIWGGTLDLHKDSGQQAMKKAGLLELYYDLALPMGIKMTDEKGKTIFSKEITSENQYDNPEINRNILRRMLLDSLTDNTVIWDRKCIESEVSDGKWLLHFENGTSATTDLIIVANGGMSKLRSYVTGTEVEDTGTMIIQGDIPQPEMQCPEFYEFCDGKRLMAAYCGNLIVVNPCNNGTMTYGVIFKSPENPNDLRVPESRDTVLIRGFLLSRFTDWDDRFKLLLHSTSNFWCLPTSKFPLEQPWKSSRPLPITLVGDAAHMMPPFAGQGVNTGLKDALILSELLTAGNHKTVEDAIESYEKEMFVYASEAQLASGKNEAEMREADFSFEQLIVG